MENIYKDALKQTNEVMRALEIQSEDVGLSQAIETSRTIFKQLKVETDATLQELDKNAEWNSLTVAFYGETNAGKSTIIETLRIIMGEKTKQEQRRKFIETCEKFNINENVAETWRQKNQEIAQCEEKLNTLISKFDESQNKRSLDEQKLKLHVDQLKIEFKKIPFWRRILSFVWKLSEKSNIDTANAELNIFLDENRNLLQGHEQEKKQALSEIELIKEEVSYINNAIAELKMHQDGAIIGDGQSDFTRESTRYEFSANEDKFVLLDVPGIEGKEELVREPIMQAVRKAHAVFYVTRKADPPQKGDENTGEKGTLEKIKEHLGAQTEVWTIFNKSIKSAEQLRTPKLVNEGELASLKVLEDEMHKQLGKHYAGSLTVSAYPAFIASADHVVPGEAKAKDRSKFLAIMNSSDILHKTGFQALVEKLSLEMAGNIKSKIKKSNFNKANDAVIQLMDNVIHLNENTFKPLLENLEDQSHDSILQLESAADALKTDIDSVATSLIKKKRESARKRIYKKIDNDIDNDLFKNYLEDIIDVEVKGVEMELPGEVKSKIEIFNDEIKGIAMQFQGHIKDFMDDASMSNDFDFDLKIKMDNGINIIGLIGSTIGAVALMFTPIGWGALAVGAFGVIVSFAKAIWAFFDSDFKKAQQRKAADQNIDKIFRSIESNYTSHLEESMKNLEANLIPIKNKFRLPAEQASQIASSLEKSAMQLGIVSQKIVKLGGL